MKKIGILTFHKAHNYGAVLQMFALSRIVGKNNNVEIIDYYLKKIYSNYRVIRPFSKNPFKAFKNLIEDLKYYKYKKRRYNAFENFINKKFILTEEYKNKKQLEAGIESINILITGSDQVWNPRIVGELSDIYTLNFETKATKISYAASVGENKFIKDNPDLYKEKISQIDYISVREEDTKNELKKIIDKNIEVVLDPTLLLTKDEWNTELKKLNQEKEKYILAYVVEPNIEFVKIVNKLSQKTDLKVIHFGLKNPGFDNVLKSAYTKGPFEFINYIKNAEYVVATSFHATIFSIIFNKKFFIIPHKKTGSRVTNLLSKLEIRDRVYYSVEEFERINYKFNTDWDKVNQILEKEREKSLNWLKKSILGSDVYERKNKKTTYN